MRQPRDMRRHCSQSGREDFDEEMKIAESTAFLYVQPVSSSLPSRPYRKVPFRRAFRLLVRVKWLFLIRRRRCRSQYIAAVLLRGTFHDTQSHPYLSPSISFTISDPVINSIHQSPAKYLAFPVTDTRRWMSDDIAAQCAHRSSPQHVPEGNRLL